ncbi:MAG TPA: alpha/beta fold hydrolase [Rhodospirillales bacterium]|jgi:pimeloyl-[acyl-carrier protein] methyl ester esterase|nr:alpha/beta fold hydrolase [Rhodospirillales bacterium]
MKAPLLVLVHGWGFDAGVWTPLCKALDGVETAAFDLGFYGRPRRPALPGGGSRPLVAVGHSLGLLWLLHERPFPWRGLIGINGFPRFAQTGDFPEGVPARILDRMAARLKHSPLRVVEDFLARSGVLKAWTAEGEPDAETLGRGLEWLRQWDGRAAFASEPGAVLLLNATADAIISEAMVRAAISGRNGAEPKWRRGGDHSLLLSDPEWCALRIRAFLAELDH